MKRRKGKTQHKHWELAGTQLGELLGIKKKPEEVMTDCGLYVRTLLVF